MEYRQQAYLSPASGAWALPSNICERGSRSARHSACRLLLVRRDGFLELLRLGVLGSGRVPVIDHLEEENSVKHEARDETVEDERVVDFLEGSEDAREGAEEVVDDL